ncbi:MAG TPA: nucleoside deaminase [Alphaproteobacteria bacterium]|nr:nucleoside deaminase [Alphaproteobacteria bacterium]
METSKLAARLLDVIERDLLPLTRIGIAEGNKLFGAAILRKSDLSLVVAAVNNETENPLWHGEMHAIKKLFDLPSPARPETKDCLFLATHEPCSLCLSGITWSGFDNFYYLFGYEDTRDLFGIPHDIRILREVYAVPDPDRGYVPPDRPLYNRSNAYFTGHAIMALIGGLDRGSREALTARVDNLSATYRELSDAYQRSKGLRGIPLA